MRARKAVDWSRHRVVEVVNRARTLELFAVEEVRIARKLRDRFAPQRLQEASVVDAGKPSRQIARAGLQVEWRRDRGGSANSIIDGIAALAEPLQKHVAAQRDSSEAPHTAGPARTQRREHEPDVPGLTRMIESPGLVRRRSASAEDEQCRSPAPCGSLRENATDVV